MAGYSSEEEMMERMDEDYSYGWFNCEDCEQSINELTGETHECECGTIMCEYCYSKHTKVCQTAALSRFNNRHHHTLNCRCGSTHIAKFHVATFIQKNVRGFLIRHR